MLEVAQTSPRTVQTCFSAHLQRGLTSQVCMYAGRAFASFPVWSIVAPLTGSVSGLLMPLRVLPPNSSRSDALYLQCLDPCCLSTPCNHAWFCLGCINLLEMDHSSSIPGASVNVQRSTKSCLKGHDTVCKCTGGSQIMVAFLLQVRMLSPTAPGSVKARLYAKHYLLKCIANCTLETWCIK